MCAFFETNGCLHGDKCDFAHDVSELQPIPDLRKSTLCINYSKGYAFVCLLPNHINSLRRCAASDCRFAHGTHELRIADALSDNVPRLCSMWVHGKCAFGAHCRNRHAFEENEDTRPEKASLETKSSSKTVISIDDSLPRQKLDLFPHLDFSNELELDAESLLSILSSELFRAASEIPVMADGDNNPWKLPN